MKKLILRIIKVSLLLMGAGVLCACLFAILIQQFSEEEYARLIAERRIKAGLPRAQVLSAFSDAWYHAACTTPEDGFGDDLFFYGPRAPLWAVIVMVRYRDDHGPTVMAYTRLPFEFIHGYEQPVLEGGVGCIPEELWDWTVPIESFSRQ